MTISKPSHKAFLFNLFYPFNQDGQRYERKFRLDQLQDASETLKKIRTSGEETMENGEPVGLRWHDEKVVDFSLGEASILKTLILEIKEATPSELEVINELKELFK